MAKQIIIDTNVIISAFIFGGLPRLILTRFFDNPDYRILCSGDIWNEIETKFFSGRVQTIAQKSRKEYISHEEVVDFVGILKSNFELVPISQRFEICRDPKDNMFLDLAFSGNADYIITGDKDLLELKSFQRTQIMTPREFLDQIV